MRENNKILFILSYLQPFLNIYIIGSRSASFAETELKQRIRQSSKILKLNFPLNGGLTDGNDEHESENEEATVASSNVSVVEADLISLASNRKLFHLRTGGGGGGGGGGVRDFQDAVLAFTPRGGRGGGGDNGNFSVMNGGAPSASNNAMMHNIATVNSQPGTGTSSRPPLSRKAKELMHARNAPANMDKMTPLNYSHSGNENDDAKYLNNAASATSKSQNISDELGLNMNLIGTPNSASGAGGQLNSAMSTRGGGGGGGFGVGKKGGRDVSTPLSVSGVRRPGTGNASSRR